MSDQKDRQGAERVKASEPERVTDVERVVTSGNPDEEPSAAATGADAIDETTAGDGVAFFEGGDGRESARDDIERSG